MARRFGDRAVLLRGLWLLLSVGSKLAGAGWGPDMQETLMLVGAYVWGMRRLCGNRILSGGCGLLAVETSAAFGLL